LPQDYPGLPNIDLAGLRDRGPLDRSDFQPKLELGRDEFEIF
jgi:hypothetical protein